MNHKLVYRLYVDESLQMRRKRPRRNRSCLIRVTREVAVARNDTWSMDFIADQLFSGQRFRLLTLVDNFSRMSPAIEVGHQVTGDHVVAILERATKEHGMPKQI
ncbi:hypothetical protein Pan189_27700 [Stratiformator vulcanicus]|uniref:Integrase catalytic domain-containing protein n=1 Tax=Stratiformator vulcanicus TaxID=2527980 RepID=A0A517R3E7_9PLAN|nr:hypothetical protein Pan189_27700 [Stratiformator vulcanicus]